MASWAIKYRPDNFNDIMGNEIAIKELNRFLGDKTHQDRPHTYLFVGPTGCGKTTLARIFAKELGCPDIVSDFHEYNSALTKGINVVRDLEPFFRIRPSGGDARIFLFEEVHRTTRDFQEAMLRPTEDTSASTYFFFCTTEPDALIPPLRKRFTEIKVRPLATRQLIKLIKTILDEEEKEIPNSILKKIADITNGEPRESIKIIERICDLDENEMTEVISKSETKIKSQNIAYLLLYQKDWKDIKSVISNPDSEPEGIRIGILNYMSKVVIGESKPNIKKRAEIIATYFFDSFMYADGRAKLIFNCLSAFNDE